MTTLPADIVVLTPFPSPYQVELFNAVAAAADWRLKVYYLHKDRPATRHWEPSPLTHDADFVSDPGAAAAAEREFGSARLAVFNFYNDAVAQSLLGVRA